MKYNQLFLVAGLITATIFATPTVYKYRIYCNSESANVYQWAESEPTTCPNDTAHIINPESISIVDQQGPAVFSIKEETVPTGGHYKTESEVVLANAGPNVNTSTEFSWPYDISVLAIYLLPGSSNSGDILTITIAPDMIFGSITQDVAAGNSIIPVSESVIANISKGYYVSLDDGTHYDDLGRVLSIDSAQNTITVEDASLHAFSASSPSLVKVNIKPVDKVQLVAGLQYTLGMKKIGGSYLPANTTVRVDYFNKSNVAKNLVLAYEYLY